MHYIYSISPIFVFSATVLILLLWINVQNSVLHMFQGFDEYMNLVLDEAEEVSVKKKSRKPLGRILLKGDNITLMMNTGK
ncbi:small nuclear ribonucleoprotein E [Citrus clementina]|nr:small nuclear ribonucleoprotein E [Citrus x clementina]